MTPNDAQIDVLLRRHAGQARRDQATEHLDADELNAFAEGSLPVAARSRYVSHLADCDDCRKLVSQLAISGGAVMTAEAARHAQSSSWWKSLSGLFSPLRLRYAALAMVVVAIAGVAFFVFRRPSRPSPESALVAQNEPTKPAPLSEVKPTNEGAPQSKSQESKQALADRPPSAQPSQGSAPLLSAEQTKTGVTTLPPKPAKETDTTSGPALAAKKGAEPSAAEPSYAPPPPADTERAETRSREQQAIGGLMSGPRKSEQRADKAQTINGGQGGEGKDLRADDENRRLTANQAPASRAANEKAKGPKRDLDNLAANNRNSNEIRATATKPQSAADAKLEAGEERAPETRSVGGRKFKRQGNAWVDSKFKSSMSLKTISRGSGEFEELDSRLRSIAQQISGEIIVVWKGKAYLIR